MATFIRILLIAVVFSQPTLAVIKPEPQTQHIAVVVNGKAITPANTGSVSVFAHDRVKITVGPNMLVNVVGLHGGSDANREFQLRSLDRAYSVGTDGSQYRVEVKSRGKLVSSFTIAEVKPELKGVEVTINQARKVMRENELMVLRKQDLFKVTSVHTNVPDNAGVEYEVVSDAKHTSATHMLRFSLAGSVFGEVPIKVID